MTQILSTLQFTDGDLVQRTWRVIAGKGGIDCVNAWARKLPKPRHRVRRPFDQLVWPFANAGFFGLKKKMP